MFNVSSAEDFKKLHELETIALSEGVGSEDKQASTDAKQILRLWKAKEDGCNACGGAGYKGRFGIYEVLENSAEIQHLIMSSEAADKVEECAVRAGMVTMQQDGLIKALRGRTTIAEVLRVTRE